MKAEYQVVFDFELAFYHTVGVPETGRLSKIMIEDPLYFRQKRKLLLIVLMLFCGCTS